MKKKIEVSMLYGDGDGVLFDIEEFHPSHFTELFGEFEDRCLKVLGICLWCKGKEAEKSIIDYGDTLVMCKGCFTQKLENEKNNR